MNAAKKGILLFLWLVVMTVATASASLSRASENRIWQKIASHTELHPFTALQVAELQWDERPFRLKLALEQTYPVNGLDPDGRFGKSLIDESQTLAASSGDTSVLDNFKGMGLGLLGTVLYAPSQIGPAFSQASTAIAQADQQISGYTGAQAVLAAPLRLAGDLSFGVTSFVNNFASNPISTVAQVPAGAANLLNNTVTSLQDFDSNPTIYRGTSIVENALGLYSLSEGGASVINSGEGLFNVAADTAGATIKPGSFSIIDWTGYPESVPQPTGPFNLLEGEEYDAARAAANQANQALRSADPDALADGKSMKSSR